MGVVSRSRQIDGLIRTMVSRTSPNGMCEGRVRDVGFENSEPEWITGYVDRLGGKTRPNTSTIVETRQPYRPTVQPFKLQAPSVPTTCRQWFERLLSAPR